MQMNRFVSKIVVMKKASTAPAAALKRPQVRIVICAMKFIPCSLFALSRFMIGLA
jgi:hypothetical protein